MAESLWFVVHGKRLRRKFKEAGALSEEEAKTIEELGLSKRELRTLKRLVFIGHVNELKIGKIKKYYLRKDPQR